MEVAQIALGILTIGASGLASGIVTFKLDSSRDARRMRREKLERLFIAHTAFKRELDVNWFPYMFAMSGEISYNDALDLTIKNGVSGERNFETIEMLVMLYFPELTKGLAELARIRDQAADVIKKHKETYKRIGPHPTPALNELKGLGRELDAHIDGFREQMAKVAQSLGARSKHAA